MKLITSFNNTIPVITVYDKDESLGVLEIMPPQWSDLHIPIRKTKNRY
jgi:hypothetical protein